MSPNIRNYLCKQPDDYICNTYESARYMCATYYDVCFGNMGCQISKEGIQNYQCQNHLNFLLILEYQFKRNSFEILCFFKMMPHFLKLGTVSICIIKKILLSCVVLKSDNLQCNTQGCWVVGTNDLSTKRLMFQAYFFP